MSFADLKAAARRVVHTTLGVPSSYRDKTMSSSVDLTVRHRMRQAIHGAADSEYADILEGINRVVFDRQELDEKGVTLRRGGQLTLPDFVLELDQSEPITGPIEVPWSVVAK